MPSIDPPDKATRPSIEDMLDWMEECTHLGKYDEAKKTRKAIIEAFSETREALDDMRGQAGEVAVMLLQNDHDGALQWARDVTVEFKSGDGAPRLSVDVERIRTERDASMKYAKDRAEFAEELKSRLLMFDDAYHDALQDDCEHGVKVLNENAARVLREGYPETLAVIADLIGFIRGLQDREPSVVIENKGAGSALLPAVPPTGWIPVAAGLPDNAEHVLIATTIWHDAHDAIRGGGHWLNLSMDCRHEDSDAEVTHWMPKPANPNSERNDLTPAVFSEPTTDTGRQIEAGHPGPEWYPGNRPAPICGLCGRLYAEHQGPACPDSTLVTGTAPE